MKTVISALAFVIGVASGCAHSGGYVWVDELQDDSFLPDSYRLHTGDLVEVEVWGHDKLSTTVRVRPDGKATLPLIGDLAAAGLTPIDWGEEIKRALGTVVVDPKITVTVREAHPPTVSVLGEVRRVGEYPLNPGDSLLELVARAGGMNEFANPDHIYVVRRQPTLLRVRFTYQQLATGYGQALHFQLRPGDIIVVD